MHFKTDRFSSERAEREQNSSGRVRPRQRTEICNFGAPSPLNFLDFAPVASLPFSPGSLCNSVRKSPQKLEKIARFPGSEKSVESCHVSGCHGFFRSRKDLKENPPLHVSCCTLAFLRLRDFHVGNGPPKAKGLQTVVSKPWFEIAGSAG